MYAQLRKKRLLNETWEHWHESQLLEAITTFVNFSKLMLNRAFTIFSFLLFLFYKGGQLMWWLVAALLYAPRPVLKIAPGEFMEIPGSLHSRGLQPPRSNIWQG